MKLTIAFLLSVLSISPFFLKVIASEKLLSSNPDSLLMKAEGFYERDIFDSAIMITNQVISYSNQIEDITYKAKACLLLGQIYSYIGVQDTAIENFFIADSLFTQLQDTSKLGETKARIGYIYRTQKNFDQAIEYYLQSLRYLSIAEGTFWFGFVNDHLGHIFLRKGNYFAALEHFQQAILAFTQLNHLTNVGGEYNAMGLIYRKTKDKEKEKQAYLDAIAILTTVDESVYLAEAYSNLAEVYLEEGQIVEGFETLEKSKLVYQNIDYPLGLASYYAVLAYHYDQLKPPDNLKVIEFASKGADIALEYESYQQYADACYYLGSAYLKLNQLEKARQILEKGKNTAEKYGYLNELEQILKVLSEVYKRLKEPEVSLLLLEQHLEYKDSLSGEKKIKEFTSLDMSFRFKQQQLLDSIAQVQKNNELIYKHEKEIQIQQLRQMVLALALIAIAFVVFFIIRSSRKRKAQNKLLDEKNQLINHALHEKELLLKEIHHRVKNNFQTISSLLELQSKEVHDEQAIMNIAEGQSRIRSMALIHQKLYQNDDLSVIDFQDYIEQLIKQITHSFSLNKISSAVSAEAIKLDIDTSIPLGLILNELITNSCKYAFVKDDTGTISVKINKLNENYILIYGDSGPGLPLDLDISKVKSLGLRLVQRLTKQLGGSFNYALTSNQFEIFFMDSEQRKLVD